MLRTKCCTSILQLLPKPDSMQYNCFKDTSLGKYIVKCILPIGKVDRQNFLLLVLFLVDSELITQDSETKEQIALNAKNINIIIVG